MKYFADLHCHPTMHPYAYDEVDRKRKNNLWWDNPPKDRQRSSTYPEYFQSSMPALARGNVKIIVAALYPLEQSWVSPNLIGTGILTDIVASKIVSHLPAKYINEVQSSSFNYFESLQKEYKFLKEDDCKIVQFEGKPWKYEIAKNSVDIKRLIKEENTIIVIPSVEGAHSLYSGNAVDLVKGNADLDMIIENIGKLKRWEHPPLYITLSHHFYNSLLGQARSIPDGAASFLLDQQVGLNEPINPRGEAVIDCLLGLNDYEGNGRRILIDAKHMSVPARIWYYAKINKYNEQRPIEERIPVLASHMGYGEHNSILDSVILPDTYNEKYENSTDFNPWSINLSDEEIGLIAKSNGIIGLNLDQRILSGNQVIKKADDFSKSEIKHNDKDVVEFWTNQFAKNLLGIVEAIVENKDIDDQIKARAWDFISLGTDFDGMINPIDSFIVSDEFIDLRNALEIYMPQMQSYEHLSLGLSIEEILDKVMFDNVTNFVLRNYA